MKELFEDINTWRSSGQNKIAIATVLKTWGSAPRRAGAKMAVDADGNISGSVSGGCVEGAVIETAREVLETGDMRLLHFGVADETAWDVGLACGGSIDVFVENIDFETFDLIQEMVHEEQVGSIATIVRGPEEMVGQHMIVRGSDSASSDITPALEAIVMSAASDARESTLLPLNDSLEVFVDVIRPAPELVAIGGGDIAIALTRMARLLGFRTTVIDPRRVFGSEARFPHVDRLIQEWPRIAFESIKVTRDTAVALLTHDPKIDDPALKILLDCEPFYIGALGSRKTHMRRLERLEKMGFTEDSTARIHAPIGLEIGAANPQEIALAVMAQIVAAYHGQV